ncbi:MAG: glycoside hydrolase family 76 protein [Prevotella sp.]
MKKILLSLSLVLLACGAGAQGTSEETSGTELAVRNVTRAMALLDGTVDKCFTGSSMKMGDTFNMETLQSEGTADVWPYTAALEATNSVLEALEALKGTNPDLYEQNHDRYVELLADLYTNLDYYRGRLTGLVSYTRTASWDVYGVHRSSFKGGATVSGIENVYDDQEWIIRELLRSYKLTGVESYLTKAVNLTDYVLDGWDCYPDANGEDYGGITWGPGYTSKHSCSNGPIISPLVWLHEIYKDKTSQVLHYTIDADETRVKTAENRADYYLDFAIKVYDWQRKALLNTTKNVFYDAAWASTGDILYVTVNGVKYRAHQDIGNPGGSYFTYNTGTMISGAADLYRVTEESNYLSDMKDYGPGSFSAFATGRRINGKIYYQFPTDASTTSGFNAWFNDVLMRSYVEMYAFVPEEEYKVPRALTSFQTNLDYAYDNYLQEGFLPIDLLGGWGENTKTKGFHQLAFASEYAMLAVHEMNKLQTSGIENFEMETAAKDHKVYGLDGRQRRSHVSGNDLNGLGKGVYIVDGKKYAVK